MCVVTSDCRGRRKSVRAAGWARVASSHSGSAARWGGGRAAAVGAGVDGVPSWTVGL